MNNCLHVKGNFVILLNGKMVQQQITIFQWFKISFLTKVYSCLLQSVVFQRGHYHENFVVDDADFRAVSGCGDGRLHYCTKTQEDESTAKPLLLKLANLMRSWKCHEDQEEVGPVIAFSQINHEKSWILK